MRRGSHSARGVVLRVRNALAAEGGSVDDGGPDRGDPWDSAPVPAQVARGLPPRTLARDVGYHVSFGTATALAFDALD